MTLKPQIFLPRMARMSADECERGWDPNRMNREIREDSRKSGEACELKGEPGRTLKVKMRAGRPRSQGEEVFGGRAGDSIGMGKVRD